MPRTYRRAKAPGQTTTVFAENTTEIDPKRVYPIQSFQRAAGVSRQRMQLAKKDGVFCTTFNVGRRVFVTGESAIAYLLALAERTERAKAKKQARLQAKKQAQSEAAQ